MVLLRPRSLLALQQQRVSTGCPQLDQVLGGGLPCGSLTEITGELKEQCVIGGAQAPPARGCRRRRCAPRAHCRRRARRPQPALQARPRPPRRSSACSCCYRCSCRSSTAGWPAAQFMCTQKGSRPRGGCISWHRGCPCGERGSQHSTLQQPSMVHVSFRACSASQPFIT
jgi:hypothetical protein